jgi:hypothetical protein
MLLPVVWMMLGRRIVFRVGVVDGVVFVRIEIERRR